MLFVCDIGNSRIKAGFFNNDQLNSIKVFKSIDELFNFISGKDITEAAVASVVPEKLEYFVKLFNACFKINAEIIDKSSKFNIKINYETPNTLGIDRICSVEGAFYLYKTKNDSINYNKNVFILTIDFGTATTINLLKYNGVFSGGLIAPGIGTMFNSLKSNTAQLPEVKTSHYKDLIGRSTKSSIASGVINSTLGMIHQVIEYLKQIDNKPNIIIYITGGNAKYMIPFVDFNFIFEEALVLYGIKAIFQNKIRK